MSFVVRAEAYDLFRGRYAEPLATQFVRCVDVQPGMQALDVGSGPGALTTELVRVLGAGAVAAVDPSPTFVAALRDRLPGVRASLAPAEQLPFPDGGFDVTLAQLVVSFMADPVQGLPRCAGHPPRRQGRRVRLGPRRRRPRAALLVLESGVGDRSDLHGGVGATRDARGPPGRAGGVGRPSRDPARHPDRLG